MSWLRVYDRNGRTYAETDMFGYRITFGVDVCSHRDVGCPVIPIDMKEYNKIRRLIDGTIPETDES